MGSFASTMLPSNFFYVNHRHMCVYGKHVFRYIAVSVDIFFLAASCETCQTKIQKKLHFLACEVYAGLYAVI